MLDAQTKAALSKAFAELAKSVPEVKDLWTDMTMNATPERGEIKTGPAEHASGSGAEKMIREYSEPAPQVALAEAYKKFDALLSDFTYMKSALGDVTGALSFIITKSVSKGRTSEQVAKALETARINLAVLKATKGDASAIAKAEKSITRLTAEQELLRSLDGLSLKDAMTRIGALTAKAEEEEEEVNITVNEEEKEKAEKAGYAKAAQDLTAFVDALAKGDEAAQTKALESAPETVKACLTALKTGFTVKKANDTHGADGKFGEKGDATSPSDKEKEDKVKSLQAQIDEIAKSMGKQSANGDKIPNLSGAGEASVRDRVVKAITDGEFSNGADITAQSLLQQYDMVQSGKLGKEVFDRNLSLAPPSVKAVFAVN